MKQEFQDIQLIAGNAHTELCQSIAGHLNVPLANASIGKFPDGETCVQINENIRGRDVFLLQPTSPPTNETLMELLIMTDAALRASAARITAVLPFYGYARQDRKDQPRVPITAKLVANLLVAAGVNRVVTMDLHAGQIQGFFDIPVDHLYALPVIVKHLRKQSFDNLTVVAPDAGGIKMAHAYATSLDAPLAIVAKNRLSATKVEALNLIGEVKGKNVLIIDDITETAGTLCAAAQMLKENGANEVYAAVSHAVLNEQAHERLNKSAIRQLFCTNSVPMAKGDNVTPIDISELLSTAIAHIHNGESVTSLFDIAEN